MKVWAHTLVKNEARWLWYSVESVINHVDRILLWDTGSTDGTLEVIKLLEKKYPSKIEFRQYGEVTPETFPLARQEMLEATKADWVLILDGDEIWWNDSIKMVRKEIENSENNIESIVVPTINVVGDMFHFQEDEAGRYQLAGRSGHLNLRAFSLGIPGFHAEGPHGTFGWFDKDGSRIEDRNPEKIKFVDAAYIHTTHLVRSGVPDGDKNVPKRFKKYKYEKGIEVPLDYYYPEAFFGERPDVVPSVWKVPQLGYELRSFLETPVKKIYRRTLMKNKKYGY